MVNVKYDGDAVKRLAKILVSVNYELLFELKKEEAKGMKNIGLDLYTSLNARDLVLSNDQISYSLQTQEIKIKAKKKPKAKLDIMTTAIQEVVSKDNMYPIDSLIGMKANEVPEKFVPTPLRLLINLEKIGKKHDMSRSEEDLIETILCSIIGLREPGDGIAEIKRYIDYQEE